MERIVQPPCARNQQEEQRADDYVEDAKVIEASNALVRILPYRAGYEAADRIAVQKALSNGGLARVASTSALEMGIDIGGIEVVVLFNTPPNVKAFRQRIGSRRSLARLGVSRAG